MIDGWTLAIETPMSSFSNSISYFNTLIVLIVNIGMLILCWLFISRTVSRPIQKMEEQMMYSKSIPENLEVDEECEDEITNLKRTYNNLLNSIRKLLERTKEEEKIIRKNELDLILEQINPHFLYNTLDVISGLTLIGDQDKSFQMTQALGRFYRNSLNSGCQVIFQAAATGEGITQIEELLRGRTTIMAGPSGVGKSSTLNCISKEKQMETGAVSEKIKRGKHTTRHSELIHIGEDTYLMDTPGFSSLFLENIEKEDLKYYFPEFEPYENTCRFNGCCHIHEPGCEVKKALEEGKISKLRYDDYCMFYEELAQQKKW